MSAHGMTGPRWAAVIVAAVLLAVLAIAGQRLWDRFDAMERQMAVLSNQVNRAADDAQVAANRATQASASATEATNQTRAAEAGRLSAINEKTQAEQARVQAEVAAREARANVDRVREERERELDHMQEILNRIVETRRTSSGLVMNLTEKALHFDFDKADLRPESRELLSRVAGILLASGGFGLSIHGHTDDVGTAAYNQTLSEKRANAVKQYLAGAGIDAGIISVKGFGKSSPLAAGNTEDARARNRRVEIVLTDTRIKYLGEARNN